MLFSKPDDLRYVDMCKEFDEEFYSGHRDDTKLFKYMYWMYYMLACKAKLFEKISDYDYYARFAASTIYVRYLRKEKQGEVIKSLKNYATKTFKPLRIMYLKDSFNHVVGDGYDDEEALAIGEYLRGSAQEGHAIEMAFDVETVLETLPTVIKKVIKQSPYRNNKLICKRLYTSCLLTLISSITLSRDNLEKLKSKSGVSEEDKVENYYLKLLTKERDKPVTLWKLDGEDWEYIVRMLVNKVRYLLSDAIDETKQSYILPDDVVDSILSATYKEVFPETGGEETY